MKQSHQDKFSQQLKTVLDKSLDDIDADSRYRLQMARAKVLQTEQDSVRWYKRFPVWTRIAGLASVSMLAAFLFINTNSYKVDDLEMMSSVDSILFEADIGIELYEQYDFYVWLSEQETNS